MLDKTWVGAVSYLNTKPLIYGFEHGAMQDEVRLILDYPSKLAERMNKGELDIALLPIVAMADIKNAFIFSEYCIGTEDEVASVCLFSEVPIDEIEEVYLDYQSRTSVALLKILLKNHWKKDVHFIAADEKYISKLKGTSAGLIIGDRAFEQLNQFDYIYDLASEWHSFTGLPFVFAAWVSNKDLPSKFVDDFNRANAIGLDHLNEIISAQQYPHYDLNVYYNKNISYKLNSKKHDALVLFRKLIREL